MSLVRSESFDYSEISQRFNSSECQIHRGIILDFFFFGNVTLNVRIGSVSNWVDRVEMSVSIQRPWSTLNHFEGSKPGERIDVPSWHLQLSRGKQMNNETVIGVENSSAIINQLQWKSSEIVEREPVDMKSDNATGSEGGVVAEVNAR